MGRRHKGEGGLVQRHDHTTCPPLLPDGTRPPHSCRGRWVGTVDVMVGGSKRRKYVYARTQKAARLKLADAVRQRDAGTLVVTTLTVEQWMTRWLAKARLKPQTRRGYRSKINQYIIPRLGRYRLTTLRPTHVDDMYDWMRTERGLAESSVRQAHAILHKALADAIKKDLLAFNPVDKADAPSTKTNKRRQFTVDQARTVLRAADDDARWWLALFYGMRQGECLGLRWCDVDLNRHTLALTQSLQTDDETYKVIFGDLKSDASARTLPLLPVVEARLRLHWVNSGQPEATTRGCEPWTKYNECGHGLVFTNNGRPIWPNDDWEAWRALIDRATVPPLAPLPYIALHAARNSAASLLEAAGVPDRVVAQILGHSTVQITHGYQEAELARIRQGMEAAGRILELD